MKSEPAPRRALVQALSDGAFHSGERLARKSGVTRSAVWKHLQVLADAGLGLERRRGRGYRLTHPVELLDPRLINENLRSHLRERLTLECHDTLASTNDHVAQRLAQGAALPLACLAEAQSAGRGRRGRRWEGAYGAGIFLSLAWRLEVVPAGLAGLAPAMAVCVAEALDTIGVHGVQLKWPNDIHLADGKLGGLLIELRGEPEGPCDVIVGAGINWALPPEAPPERSAITAEAQNRPGRNRTAAVVLNHLSRGLERFAVDGFGGFSGAWQARDMLEGQPVRLDLPNRHLYGVATGLDAQGALLVAEPDNGVRPWHVGEVSVRTRDGSAA